MARANWTPRMESCLVGVLVKQAREGKRAENGFKKEAKHLWSWHSPQPIPSKIDQVMLWKIWGRALWLSRGWWLRGGAAGDGTRQKYERYPSDRFKILVGAEYWKSWYWDHSASLKLLAFGTQNGGFRLKLSGRGNLTGSFYSASLKLLAFGTQNGGFRLKLSGRKNLTGSFYSASLKLLAFGTQNGGSGVSCQVAATWQVWG